MDVSTNFDSLLDTLRFKKEKLNGCNFRLKHGNNSSTDKDWLHCDIERLTREIWRIQIELNVLKPVTPCVAKTTITSADVL